MGIHKIEIGDVQVKVHVMDHPDVIDSNMKEFINILSGRRRVVGFDVKFNSQIKYSEMLILCTANRCLMIPVCCCSVPQSVKDFLLDRTICFVGLGMKEKIQTQSRYTYINCYGGIDVGDLAARVLKKPDLMKSTGLAELAKEAGIDSLSTKLAAERPPNWGTTVFTDKQIVYAVQEVYESYVIADKLLASLA